MLFFTVIPDRNSSDIWCQVPGIIILKIKNVSHFVLCSALGLGQSCNNGPFAFGLRAHYFGNTPSFSCFPTLHASSYLVPTFTHLVITYAFDNWSRCNCICSCLAYSLRTFSFQNSWILPIILCQPQTYFFIFFSWLHFLVQELFSLLS
jgi:hypothetical protein